GPIDRDINERVGLTAPRASLGGSGRDRSRPCLRLFKEVVGGLLLRLTTKRLRDSASWRLHQLTGHLDETLCPSLVAKASVPKLLFCPLCCGGIHASGNSPAFREVPSP